MSTMCQGFNYFSGFFLHYFVLSKLANSRIKANKAQYKNQMLRNEDLLGKGELVCSLHGEFDTAMLNIGVLVCDYCLQCSPIAMCKQIWGVLCKRKTQRVISSFIE